MKEGEVSVKKVRDSNIELLRILMMLVIIAHHYIVNSGINPLIFTPPPDFTFNYAFALCFGFGGKMAINVFILITGWFMCRQEFRWRKVVNLLCLMVFYTYVIYAAFVLSGYDTFSLRKLAGTLFFVQAGFGHGFAPSFLGLYVLIPFINIAVENLGKKEFKRLIFALLFLFSILSISPLDTPFQYISWYATVYLIGCYLRLHPLAFLEKRKNCAILVGVCLALCYASILLISFIGCKIQKLLPFYWFVSDSNKMLALATAISLFCFFKTFRLGHIKVINALAASTFGILLIHASSDTMRNWLWNDVMHSADAYGQKMFPLYALGAMAVVYLSCFAIDFIRRNLLRLVTKAVRSVSGEFLAVVYDAFG